MSILRRLFAKKYEEYLPQDMENIIDENSSLTQDGSGNLNIRGQVLTDEGSFRDDFNTTLSEEWEITASNDGSTSQSTTIQTVNLGTTSGSYSIKRFGDYSPIIFKGYLAVSQRIANQTIEIGFTDDVDTPVNQAIFLFDGTTNTTLKVKTQSSTTSGNSETYTHTIPNGKNSAQYLLYTIHVIEDQIAFFIDDILIRTCKLHIPDSFAEMYIYVKGTNSTTVSATSVTLDYAQFINQNQVEVKNDFSSKPIPTQQIGDQHHISAQLTVNSTTADQTILSYTVPTNRIMKIIGYSIETNNTGGTIKIGKNTISSPIAGGEVDSNLFRQMKFQNASINLDSFRQIDLSAFPRIVASSGDAFKVLVTPSNNISTLWTVTIDFILI